MATLAWRRVGVVILAAASLAVANVGTAAPAVLEAPPIAYEPETSTAPVVLDTSDAIQSGAEVIRTDTPRCQRPPRVTPPDGVAIDLKTHDAYAEWLANDAAQAANKRLHAVVSAAGPRVLGMVADDTNQHVVVILDPAYDLDQQLLADLGNAVGNDLALLVQPGCRRKSEVEGVEEAVLRRDWHPDARTTPFGIGYDPSYGAYVITMPPEARLQAQALRERFGDAIVIEEGTPTLYSRLNDGNPHYGGARIGFGTDAKQQICTAGFTLVRPDGKHFMATAGHCFTEGTFVYSGAEYFGFTSNEAYNYPASDVILIESGTETYDRRIHVDPCCPVVRAIVGRADLVLNEYTCTSGAWTRAVCGARVIETGRTWCYLTGCRENLTIATRPGVTIAQPGDSGGPTYQRSGSNSAIITGMIVGGPCSAGPCDTVHYHPVKGVIETLYGMTTKTSGGAG